MTAGPARTGGISDLLDGLEAAAKAATPGPWRSEETGLVYPDHIETEYAVMTGDGWDAASVIRCHCRDDDGAAEARANAACIVAEHNAAPLLVAAIRAVEREHDGRNCCDRTMESFEGLAPCPTVTAMVAALGAES